MASAAPRHGRAPDLPVRPVIATPLIATPEAEPDGPVSVGSLLRREGRRAAHALDRPLVPRARDLGSDGRSTHGVAVAAGTLLAITAVLGSNALGDPALLSGVGIDDATDPGPVTAPAPADPSSPAADVSVGGAVAALQEAAEPVQALLTDGLPGGAGSDAVSGAGIVAAVLGSPSSGGAAVVESDDDTRDDSSDGDSSDGDSSDSDADDGDDTDDRSSSSRTDDGSDGDRDDGDSDERDSGERDTSDDTDDTPDGTDEDPDEDTSDDERPSPSPAEGESPDDGSESPSDEGSDDGSGDSTDDGTDSDADAGTDADTGADAI